MEPLLLVLCQTGDTSAQWVHSHLLRRYRRVELVYVEDLASPTTTWDLRVGTSGVRVRAVLADGREIGGAAVVLNRMIYPPASILSVGLAGDADYAQSELTAFAMSWLTALAPRVLNRPTPAGLSGRWRSTLHWRALAARAGLPVVPLAMDSSLPVHLEAAEDVASTTVLSLGGRLVADAPSVIHDGVREFARLADTPILGLRFAGADPDRGGWRLLDATPHPDLGIAGEAGIDALEEVLAA